MNLALIGGTSIVFLVPWIWYGDLLIGVILALSTLTAVFSSKNPAAKRNDNQKFILTGPIQQSLIKIDPLAQPDQFLQKQQFPINKEFPEEGHLSQSNLSFFTAIQLPKKLGLIDLSCQTDDIQKEQHLKAQQIPKNDQSVQAYPFSQDASQNTEKPQFQFQTSTTNCQSYKPVKRNVNCQTIIEVQDCESATDQVHFTEKQSQTWQVLEEQAIGTTQSLENLRSFYQNSQKQLPVQQEQKLQQLASAQQALNQIQDEIKKYQQRQLQQREFEKQQLQQRLQLKLSQQKRQKQMQKQQEKRIQEYNFQKKVMEDQRKKEEEKRQRPEIQREQKVTHDRARARSNSEDFQQEFFNQKELILSQLSVSTMPTDQTTFNFYCHVLAETPIPKQIFNQFSNLPINLAFISFADESLSDLNYGLFKEFFTKDQRFIKLKSLPFSNGDNRNFLSDQRFQILFSSIFLSNISDYLIIIVDSSQLNLQQSQFFKYLFSLPKKDVFILHSSSLLESSAIKFTEKLDQIQGVKSQLKLQREQFWDQNRGIRHLKAGSTQTFEFLQTYVIKKQLLTFDRENSCFYNPNKQFSFQSLFQEALVNALKILLVPVFQPSQPHFISLCNSQDYGFSVSAEYTFMTNMPRCPLFDQKQLLIHIHPLAVQQQKLFSILQTNPEKLVFQQKPLFCLFLSTEQNKYLSLFGPQLPNQEFLDILPIKTSNVFQNLTSWLIGSYLADIIIMTVDFQKDPELHHSDLLFNYFSLLTGLQKPIFVLHQSQNYAYSFRRTNELIQQACASDRMLLHQQIFSDPQKNLQVLQSIRQQMVDNLFVQGPADLPEKFRSAVQTVANQVFSVQNSRNREILVKMESLASAEGVTAGVQLQTNWNCSIKEEAKRVLHTQKVYVTPIFYNIDQDLSCLVQGETSDQMVKVALVSNLPSESLSFSLVQLVQSCFAQHTNQVLFLLPSSQQNLLSALNHINSAQFNSLSQYLVLDLTSDCLVVLLKYSLVDSKPCLDYPQSFANLKKLFEVHFQGVKKPVMVIHYVSELNDSVFAQALSFFNNLLGIELELPVHQDNHQGIYAFDPEHQVIHRGLSSNSPLGWLWYNTILYKIMHDACLKQGVVSVRQSALKAVSECLRKLLVISEYEENVIPMIQAEKRNGVLKLVTKLEPAWIIDLV